MRFLLPESILSCFLLTIQSLQAQGVNQLRIIPTEPTTADTITVISDFSYEGACAFGLVYEYIYTTDTSIYIAPTYCGYFGPDSVLCQSIDTFKIPPLTAGTYQLQIEYHQGSICPISDFDAVIATFDTSIVVSGTQSIPESLDDSGISVLIYPNPAQDAVTIQIDAADMSKASGFTLLNAVGQIIIHDRISDPLTHLSVAGLKGLHVLNISGRDGQNILVQKIILL